MPNTFKLDICNSENQSIQSYNNIGEPDIRGLPATIQHQINLIEASDDIDHECIKIIDPTNILENLQRVHPDITLQNNVINNQNQLTFSRLCQDEASCAFTIHPTLSQNINHQDNRSFTERINPTIKNEMNELNIDPTDREQLTYFTMKKKFPDYGLKFRNVSMQQWKETFYPRLEAWKDRPEFPNVSLAAKIFVETPSLRPRNINSYGMEVECDGPSCGTDFYEESHRDDSGPREITTSGHIDPKALFSELAEYHYIQHGQSDDDCDDCGSHFHVAPQDYERTYFRTYRGLMGYFAPFFAGTIAQQSDADFNFRQGVENWAKVPPLYDNDELRSMTNSKRYYVHPHPRIGRKPFTFEFRLNEAVAPSTVTGINIMSRIADAFVDTRTTPRWSNELIEMDRSAIQNRVIKKIANLNTILTHDRRTADIMSLVLQKEIEPGQTVSLLEILDASKKTMPMDDYETAWVERVQRGETWSKTLRNAGSETNQMLLTRKMLREFLDDATQQRLTRADRSDSLRGDIYSDDEDEYESDICDSGYDCDDDCNNDDYGSDDELDAFCNECC